MGEATWFDKCPCCDGQGKIQIKNKQKDYVRPPQDCMACEGRGVIPLMKKIEKKEE